MPTVIFYQSKKEELETILWTIKNYKKIKKFCNDIIYPKLPKNLWQSIVKDDQNFTNSKKEVKEYLEDTNQLDLKLKIKRIAIPLWTKMQNDFFERIEEISEIKPLKKYICYLTKYGGGGSFNPPNTIWVRINPRNKNDLKYFTYTVAHEITHLLLNKKHKDKLQETKEKEIDQILLATGLFK